ncbi:MAG: DNA primase [Acidimicrobiales bacterium]|nr:MAG: DNA primase [Actinomycetota bacterium]MBV6507534.1 DNA primase [Acidimicrobiales bacterium]RIK07476.1 MAG: DNA primase [Acidobacteriota bacterium]
MGIVDEDVVRVREASDIVAIVSQHTQLKKVGRRQVGLCPFHNEKTPSFSVNSEEGLYYCFGCGAKGDVITFVRDVEHLDFVGAVEWLAAKAGVTLRYTDRSESENRKRRLHLQGAVEKAVDWYHELLLSDDDAGTARGYLRQRGFDKEMVERYRLGWAPRGWDALSRRLRLSDADLTDSGLGFVNTRGRQQDFFRGRVLFPIFDDQGRPIAFGGRLLPGDEDGPKYQNSKENVLYQKSRTLYGLNWAKADVVASGEVIVCEGYTDVIGFNVCGIERAVATCGTSLTEDHFRTLRRYAPRVVLAYDADEAGSAASERVYEWEQAYGIDVAVADLPDGVDPDELARADPAALVQSVADARPLLAFRIERLFRRADVSTAEGRARAASAALDLVREHPSELVRDQYVMEIADACRVDPEHLRAQLAAPARVRGRQAGPADLRPPGHDAEVEAIRLAVLRPQEVAPLLDERLFIGAITRPAYRALASAETLHEAISAADPDVGELLTRVAVEESTAEPLDVVARLVGEAVNRALHGLESEARRAEDPLEYASIVAWLKLRLEELREPETVGKAAEQLLAWLTERSEDGND